MGARARRARKPLSPPPDSLTDEEKREVVSWLRVKQAEGLIPRTYGRREVAEMHEACLLWHQARDEWKRDWAASLKEWIRREAGMKRESRERYRRREYPQERRGDSSGQMGLLDLEEMGKVISIYGRGKR